MKKKNENIYHKAPTERIILIQATWTKCFLSLFSEPNWLYDAPKQKCTQIDGERLSSLNFALWANILSNLNKYQILFSISCAPVCVSVSLSEPQNFQEHSPSQLATHSFLSACVFFYFIQFCCIFSIHAGHFSVAIEKTRQKKTPSFSIETNLFQLNSKWAESFTICSKCSQVAWMFVNIVGDCFANQQRRWRRVACVMQQQNQIDPNFMFLSAIEREGDVEERERIKNQQNCPIALIHSTDNNTTTECTHSD